VNPYDEIEYPRQVFPQMHPDRLATIATLRGLEPAHPLRCRLLDLGCGDGLSVLAFAQAAPESEFVGVDLAAAPVARGNELREAAGIRNARILQGDASTADPAWGTFDYVVAHGLYSWVPAPVRERLLGTVAACLRPGGVGYVSYGARPGAVARQVVRDVMLFHTASASSSRERVERSYELLRTLAAARRRKDDPWEAWLAFEVQERLSSDPTYLRHDDLGEVNEPIWYRDFAAHAARHGLACLGEADWTEDSDIGFAPEVREAISRIQDPVDREQFRDLLKFRRFRQTLLVHRGAAPSAEIRADRIPSMYLSGEVRPPETGAPLHVTATETFTGPRNGRAGTDAPIVRAALRILGASWPRRIAFDDLHRAAAARVQAARAEAAAAGQTLGPAADDERASLCDILGALHDARIVHLHVHTPAYVVEAGERPVVSPLARTLAILCDRVVSLLQHTIDLEDVRSRRLVSMLDGTVDRAEILRRLVDAEASEPVPEGSPRITPELVDRTLAGLARRAFLVS
jgi:SAM-dependent methyltransferase